MKKIYESPDGGKTVYERDFMCDNKVFHKLHGVKYALVLGGGGFIGGHLVTRLKKEGYWVRVVDIKPYPDFNNSSADEYVCADLRDYNSCESVIEPFFDEVYALAADMGGAAFIFTGENDFDIMHNSALINLNVAKIISEFKNNVKIFYSSSACAYPAYNQEDPSNPKCSEDSCYPAAPDSEYGWEKIFSERMYFALSRNKNVNVKIARFHNVFGPLGTYTGGREKAPSAMCRKLAEVKDGGEIEIFGDGEQTRSFLYIDECVEGILRLMNSNFTGPVNIGSDEMITINKLVEMVSKIAGKTVTIKHIDGPLGVRGRNSDNNLIKKELNWSPSAKLNDGLIKTYEWVNNQINTISVRY